MKRKGSGRKKGQLTKVKERGLSPVEIVSKAHKGDQRPDVMRVYQHLRTLAYKRNTLGTGCEDSLEAYEAMTEMVQAVIGEDAAFFNELGRTVALMVKNDAAPNTILSPPADVELYWLGKLREYYEAESNVFSPPFFSESVAKVLLLPRDKRPPLTLNQIGDFMEIHTGIRMNIKTISKKAKIVGIPVHGQFGRKK